MTGARRPARRRFQVPHDPVDLAPTNLTAALAEGGGVTLDLDCSGGGRR